MLCRQMRYLQYKLIIILLFGVLPRIATAQRAGARNTVIEKIKTLNEAAGRLNSDSTNQALTYAHEAYLLAIKAKEKRWQAVSMLTLSEGYLYNESYDQALQYAYDALDIFQSLNNIRDIAEAYTMLGWIFYDTENFNLAMSFHRKANALYTSLQNEKKRAASLNAVGLVFQALNGTDSARACFQQALLLAQKNRIQPLIGATFNNIGICENTLGNYEQAIGFFRQALEMDSERKGNVLLQAEVQNQMAFSYLKLRNYKRADSLLTASRALIDASTSNTRKEKLLDNLNTFAQLYQATGDYKKAFENLQEYAEINNEIVSRNKTEVVTALHLKREAQQSEKKINELNAQKELRVFQRNALAAGIVLLAVIGFLLYSRMRHRQLKEKEIEAMKQLLIQKELDTTIQEKEALNHKLDFKDKSLKKYAISLSRNNELLRNFIQEAGNILEEDSKGSRLAYDKLVRKFLQELEHSPDNAMFDLNLDKAHADFFYNLLQKYPGLTDNERKLCGQIRLNLTSKEIASLNNISVKSVEMARYRLRKHFELGKNEDLNEFLHSF